MENNLCERTSINVLHADFYVVYSDYYVEFECLKKYAICKLLQF